MKAMIALAAGLLIALPASAQTADTDDGHQSR